MLYNKPACEIYIFEGRDFNKLKKAAEIYKKKNNLSEDKLYNLGYMMLFEKINEILQSEENND